MTKTEITYQNHGNPGINDGKDNEVYLNIDTNELFIKENNVWKSKGKRRGRKPGIKIQKTVSFVCVGFTAVEEIFIHEVNSNCSEDDLKTQAIKIFKSKHKEDPSFVFGGFYRRKSSSVEEKNNDIDISNISFKEDKLSATFEDWNVGVKLIEDFEDYAFIIFKSHKDENCKKTKPFPRIVKINNLTELTQQN